MVDSCAKVESKCTKDSLGNKQFNENKENMSESLDADIGEILEAIKRQNQAIKRLQGNIEELRNKLKEQSQENKKL